MSAVVGVVKMLMIFYQNISASGRIAVLAAKRTGT
jgi:hypothetical protein